MLKNLNDNIGGCHVSIPIIINPKTILWHNGAHQKTKTNYKK
tara:strand:+ start:1465 stop:1590 length:126 start_codon:yes stop_codon:yes gene_type:complete